MIQTEFDERKHSDLKMCVLDRLCTPSRSEPQINSMITSGDGEYRLRICHNHVAQSSSDLYPTFKYQSTEPDRRIETTVSKYVAFCIPVKESVVFKKGTYAFGSS
jgi:hypothetical protein